MGKPRIFFYNDGRHPLIYMYEPPQQKEEFEAAVDELLGTPVEALVFALGEGRTMLHDTQAGELWGHNVQKWPHLIWRRAHQNAKMMIDEGNDPLRIICDRARSEGVLIYPSLNVQWPAVPRGEGTVWVRVSDFRWNNKHLEIGADGSLDPTHPAFGCLDFGHQESRAERFAIVEETVQRYPVDGFELNLNSYPHFFHPDQVDQGRSILTEWVRRVYETVKASGANRELLIRVSTNPDASRSAGMDVEEWVREGIVDTLVVQDRPGIVNQMADFRPLVRAARNSSTRILAAIQNIVNTDRVDIETVEMLRATACNYWAQGIDGLFLDRGWFLGWPYGAPFYQKLRELPYPRLMEPKDKHYHLLTEPGRPVENTSLDTPAQLPAKLVVDRPARLDFTITDDLPRWDRAGRVHEVLLRIRLTQTTELDGLRFRLNGRELPRSALRKINHMYKMHAPRFRVFGYWFVYTLEPEYWPAKGSNTLEVTLLKRDPEVSPEIAVNDVELETRYLMGKNFHRGYVDPDLGPYEFHVT